MEKPIPGSGYRVVWSPIPSAEKKILCSINAENAPTILQAANLHSAMGLRQCCMDFILNHFDCVSKTPAFEEMSRNNIELVIEILKRR